MFVPQRFKAKLFGGRFHVFVLRHDQHAGKALPRDRIERMLDKRLSVYRRGELVLAKARGIARRHDHASYFQRVIHLKSPVIRFFFTNRQKKADKMQLNEIINQDFEYLVNTNLTDIERCVLEATTARIVCTGRLNPEPVIEKISKDVELFL